MAHQAVQRLISEESEDGNTPKKGMGTFFVQEPKPHHIKRQGPVFVGKTSHDPTQIQKISDIQESAGITKRVLETLDARRLSGLVAQEAIKIGNLPQKRMTPVEMKNLRRALYALDPNKYRFLSPENETTDLLPPQSPTPLSSSKKETTIPKQEIKTRTPSNKNDLKIHRPAKKALRLVEKDIDSLLVAPPHVPKPPLEHPLLSRVRPQIQEVSPSRSFLDMKKIKNEPIEKPVIEKVLPSLPPQVSSEKEKHIKLQAVNTLIETLYANSGEASDFASPLKGSIPKEEALVLPSHLPVIETKSWRDSLEEDSQLFMGDIMKLDGDSLLMKYLGLDRSASNASLLSDAGNSNPYDVLHNLDPDKYNKREELSKLIVNMEKIASAAGKPIEEMKEEVKGFTVNILREKIRAIIASSYK